MTCEKKDAIPIKNQLVSLKNRNERIAQRAAERAKQMQAALRDADEYVDAFKQLDSFADQTLADLANTGDAQEAATGDRIRDQLDAHRRVEDSIQGQQPVYAEFEGMARAIVEQAPNGEKKELAKRNDGLKGKWAKMEDVVAKR